MDNLIRILKIYKSKYLKNDLMAGISVATIALPQNMAYALIVGVSPIYGLYTSIVSMIVATFVGSSDYMVVGPTNLMSMALANALANVGQGAYVEVLFLLTFMVGVIQIVLGLVRLSDLVKYVPDSVIIGLNTGIALIIGIGQIDDALGLEVEQTGNIFLEIYELIINLPGINYYSLAITILSILIILFSKKISKKIPNYLIAIIVSTFLVYVFNLGDKVEVVNEFSLSLPTFNMINFNLQRMRALFSFALSIAILGFIQTLSIVKALEEMSTQEVKLTKEFIGQGIINTICSFFSSFATSGSFTNSFANYHFGAKSRISEFFTASIIILFILFLNPFAQYIPIASLAALVIIVAISMINLDTIKLVFRTTRFDTIVFIITFLTTVLSPRIDYAVYFGVTISLILLLRSTDRVDFSYITYKGEKEDTFSVKSKSNINEIEDPYVIINLAGNLYFNSAKNLKSEFNTSFVKDKVFIIRMRSVEYIDLTAIKVLNSFIDKVNRYDGQIYFSGVDDKLFKKLESFGIVDKISEDNIFFATKDIFSSTKDVIKRVDKEREE
ncbi:SulP family inorganic anion transporter [Halonatronum saccharophilum]|uniref:SulP family inorganic anion transporter n=1 Tax=Halonatronum saccharophilum TaxID=150060 RepID=UPI00048762B6|nr:SulP family inorganic anion transporter [Halonatronum saccharophilum]